MVVDLSLSLLLLPLPSLVFKLSVSGPLYLAFLVGSRSQRTMPSSHSSEHIDLFDSVIAEPVVNITNWIRGTEWLTMLSPRVHSMAILGLGTSVGMCVISRCDLL